MVKARKRNGRLTNNQTEFEMDFEFYSISERKKVTAKVVAKVDASTEKRKSYILKGQTADGKKLTAMVNKETYDSIVID